MSKGQFFSNTSVCLVFMSSPCKSCSVRNRATFSLASVCLLWLFHFLKVNYGQKLKPSNFIWLSTVFFHSSFTSALAEILKLFLRSFQCTTHRGKGLSESHYGIHKNCSSFFCFLNFQWFLLIRSWVYFFCTWNYWYMTSSNL